MIEILEPLKVGNSDTTSIDVHVRNDQASLLLEDLVSSRSDGSIGSFTNDLGLNLVSIGCIDHLLHGSGYEDVAGLVHDVLAGVGLGSGESNNSSMLQLPVFQSLWINTFWIVNGTVPLCDTNTLGANSGQIATGVETHVTKSLNNVSFSQPPNIQTQLGHILLLLDEVIQTMEDSSACGAGSAVDTSLVDGFASDASAGVHVGVPNSVGISVSNPSHLPLTSAHVWGRNINTRSKESFLGKFDGEPPCDPLQFILTVLLGVNLDTCLATSEGDVHTGALVGHQGRQGLDLISTDVSGVSDTSLAWRSVVTVLRSVAIDHLVTSIISLKRKVDFQHMGTGLNDFQDAMSLLGFLFPRCFHCFQFFINKIIFCKHGGFMKKVLDHFKESRIRSTRNILQSVGDLKRTIEAIGGMKLELLGRGHIALDSLGPTEDALSQGAGKDAARHVSCRSESSNIS